MKKFLSLICVLFLLTGCVAQSDIGNAQNNQADNFNTSENAEARIPQKTGSLELLYAEQFSADFYEDGYVHIFVGDGSDYVLVPQDKEENTLGFESPIYIKMPCERIYLAASSAMDLFLQLDSLDNIAACSTKSSDYAMEAVRDAIDTGKIEYVGKYNAPDYEALLRNNCGIAIESTMIGHTPKTKEQLEVLGIPVFVERSSYETDPLGRLEWIKLYGLLAGKASEANTFFDEQIERLERLQDEKASEPESDSKVKVAFFSVTSSGYITVRKPGDYICKMIEMAGGEYALDDLLVEEDNALSTINIGMEDFYREAVDADILIYNGSIDGGINSLNDLLSKSELFMDFKAVKNSKVWSTGLNMFQESSKTVDVICEMADVISGSGEQHYLKHLD